MPHSADCPEGRSQLFTFARRDFLQKAASVALPFLVPRSQPVVPSRKLPKPKFAIGDLIASDWVTDADDYDAPDSATDFGEILGIRWPSKRESESAWTPNTWVYFVRWTHSTIGASSCYPCYDGEPSRECDLRLVKHD